MSKCCQYAAAVVIPILKYYFRKKTYKFRPYPARGMNAALASAARGRPGCKKQSRISLFHARNATRRGARFPTTDEIIIESTLYPPTVPACLSAHASREKGIRSEKTKIQSLNQLSNRSARTLYFLGAWLRTIGNRLIGHARSRLTCLCETRFAVVVGQNRII